MNRYLKYFLFVLSLVVVPQLIAQGIVPFGGYDYSEVGAVNVGNGTLSLEIPVLTYKQKGDLPDLTLSVSTNGSSSWFVYNNTDSGVGDTYWKPAGDYLRAPSVQYHVGAEYVESADSVYYPDPGVGTYYPLIRDRFNTTHLVGYDRDTNGSTNQPLPIDQGRSLDGSGLMFTAGGIRDRQGVTYDSGTCLQGICTANTTDKNGNHVTRTYPENASVNIGTSFLDSYLRTFPAIPDGAGCYPVNLPGMTNATNGGIMPVTICRSSHSINTSLGNNNGQVGVTPAEYSITFIGLDSITYPNGTFWGFHYDNYGDIVKIDLPSGGNVQYEWAPYDSCSDGQVFVRHVTSRTTFDGTNSRQWKYYFERGIVEDPDRNQTMHVTGVGCGGGGQELAVHYFNGTAPTESSGGVCSNLYQYFAAPNLVKSEITQFNLGPQSMSAYPGWSVPNARYTYWPDGKVSATVYVYDDTKRWVDINPGNLTPNAPPIISNYTTGTVLSQEEHDYGQCAAGALLRQTDTTYDWTSSNNGFWQENLLGYPSRITIRDGALQAVAKTDNSYDESTRGPSGIHANLTTKTQYIDATAAQATVSNSVTSHTNYNSDGMAISIFDGNLNETTISYTCNGALPYEVTKGGLTTRYAYDCNIGKVTSVKDQNDITSNRNGTTFTYYDSWDISATDFPDGGHVGTDYNNYSLPLTAVTTTTASPNRTTTTYYDKLARPTKTETDEGGNSVITVDTTYDNLGRVYTVSSPYRGTPVVGSKTTYDVLGRTKTVTHEIDGTHLDYDYKASTTDTTDEVSKTIRRTFDALGRLTDVYEDPIELNPAGLNLHTVYVYDALDNIKLVHQYGSSGDVARTRQFEYDSLSRMTKSCNPEALSLQFSCDGTHWSQTYSYDANNNVTSKTDGKGSVNMNYDSLNRLVEKWSLSGQGNTVANCYQYDASSLAGTNPNLAGRLANEWTQASRCPAILPGSGVKTRKSVLAYDEMGREKSVQTCILSNCSTGTPYTFAINYDLAGNLLDYGNGLQNLTLTNSYDAAGRLKSVSSNLDPAHPAYNVTSFYPHGAPGTLDLGSQIGITRTYDNRLRIKGSTAKMLSTPPVVPPSASLVSNPFSLSFSQNVGTTTPSTQSVTVSNPSGTALGLTVSSNSSWLTVTPSSGTTPGNFTIGVQAGSLSAGVYNGTVTVRSVSPVLLLTIPVAFQVASLPSIISTANLNSWTISPLGGLSGWSSNGSALIYNGSGIAPLYAGNSSWNDYDLSVNLTLPASNYPGGIRGRVNPSNGSGYAVWFYPEDHTVNLYKVAGWNISDGSTLIGSYTQLAFDTNAHTFKLSMSGSAIKVFYDGTQLINATDTTYSSGLIALDPSNQVVHYNSVAVTNGGGTPTATASPAALTFSTAAGAAATAQTVILSSSPSSITWAASSNAAWLTASPSQGTSTPAFVSVNANAASLAAGSYSGTLTLTPSAGNPIQIGVTLIVHSGSLLFEDQFNSGSSQWAASPLGMASNWSVANGTFNYNGGGATQQYAGSQSWTDYSISAVVTLANHSNYPGGIRGRINLSTGASYAVWLYPADNTIKLFRTTGWAIDSPGLTTLGEHPNILLDTSPHVLRLQFSGNQITVYYDNQSIISATDSTLTSGAIGLDVSSQPISFDNVTVQ